MESLPISKPRKSLVRRVLQVIGSIIAGLLGLIVLGAIAIFAISESRIQQVYTTQPAPLDVPNDPASIERGRHLVVHVMACVDCHGGDLAGGTVADDPMLGRVSAPNLTPGQGGVLAQMSNTDIVRVLRHGVGPDGKSLVIMPVDDYVAVSAPDMAAIIAYLRSIPPIDKSYPPNELRPLGRTLIALRQAPLLSAESVPQSGGFPETTPVGVTLEYGRYLARTSGCMGCHGATLSGGPIPGAPPEFGFPSNITPAGAVVGWTDEQLVLAIRTGMRPGGAMIDDVMPYRYYAGMSDEEVYAIIKYLRSVPGKPYGNR
jgi:mono/diheme cytochrome c family protein